MKIFKLALSIFVTSCASEEVSQISNGTQRYISPPFMIGCEGFRYYSPIIDQNKNRYIWKTKINHVFGKSGKSNDSWMFKLSFLRGGKRFSLPDQSVNGVKIKYRITNELNQKTVFLASDLNEWCRSESPDEMGGAIYWPDFLQNKRLQKEIKNIEFDLESNKFYDITVEIDVSQSKNFSKDTKCLVELGFGGFL